MNVGIGVGPDGGGNDCNCTSSLPQEVEGKGTQQSTNRWENGLVGYDEGSNEEGKGRKGNGEGDKDGGQRREQWRHE
jgi:hypothetical protein